MIHEPIQKNNFYVDSIQSWFRSLFKWVGLQNVGEVSREQKIDTLLENRERFNAYVYTPWREALDELNRRDTDTKLDTYVRGQLPRGLPEVMRGRKSMVLFRHLATPNYEICRFLISADALQDLAPLILEYAGDKFTNRNDWKFSLAKMRFHKGKNKHGEPIFEFQNIVDVNKSNNKPLAEIKTHWGQSLPDFHRELFNKSFPNNTCAIFDVSEWLQNIGPSAKEYYKSFFAMFLKDGILFENFAIDGSEHSFTREVILPAIIELEEETGYKPLIVALEPTTIEGDHFWLSYPHAHKQHLEEKMKTSSDALL